MRTLAALAALAALALSLASLAGTADAKPHKPASKATKAAQERFVLECVDERTGPDGGIELGDAMKLCRGIVRHNAKITKLARLAAQARSQGLARLAAKVAHDCAEEVSIACEDTTERAEDNGECSDKTLEAKHAFDVCRGKAPIAEGK